MVGSRPISWSGWKEETRRRLTGREDGYRSLWVSMGVGGGGWVPITTGTHRGRVDGYTSLQVHITTGTHTHGGVG